MENVFVRELCKQLGNTVFKYEEDVRGYIRFVNALHSFQFQPRRKRKEEEELSQQLTSAKIARSSKTSSKRKDVFEFDPSDDSMDTQ